MRNWGKEVVKCAVHIARRGCDRARKCVVLSSCQRDALLPWPYCYRNLWGEQHSRVGCQTVFLFPKLIRLCHWKLTSNQERLLSQETRCLSGGRAAPPHGAASAWGWSTRGEGRQMAAPALRTALWGVPVPAKTLLPAISSSTHACFKLCCRC